MEVRKIEMALELDHADRLLLNSLQASFPLVETPFERIGHDLGMPPAEVLKRARRLRDQRIVRQIGAIFDTRRLGYRSTLVAMAFPEASLDAGARVISEHPGVSHNYARTGPFNLWFTLAVPPGEDLEAAVAELAARAGARTYRLMPTLRFFKIGVNFDMVVGEGASEDAYHPNGHPGPVGEGEATPLTPIEVGAVRALQEDLPLVARPFDHMAAGLGVEPAELLRIAVSLQRRGLMRRFGAVLNHRRAGFTANAMVVWKVPEQRAEEVGQTMARSRWVTHCYQRPTFADWPYTHFTMVHADSRERCEEVARELSDATGIRDYALLFSTREYKKTRVRYFV